jgi:hypothetical protein
MRPPPFTNSEYWENIERYRVSQLHDFELMGGDRGIVDHHDGGNACPGRRFEGVFEFAIGRDSDIFQFKSDLLTGQLHVSNNECRALAWPVPQDRHARHGGHEFLEQRKPFPAQVRSDAAQPCDIGAGTGEVRNNA